MNFEYFLEGTVTQKCIEKMPSFTKIFLSELLLPFHPLPFSNHDRRTSTDFIHFLNAVIDGTMPLAWQAAFGKAHQLGAISLNDPQTINLSNPIIRQICDSDKRN